MSIDAVDNADTWLSVFDEVEHLDELERLDKLIERTRQVRTLEATLTHLKSNIEDLRLAMEVSREVSDLTDGDRFYLLVARTVRIKDLQAKIAEYVTEVLP